MKISETWRYDASPDQVWAMLTDTAFQERKCAASGALSYDTSIAERDDGSATIVVSREMPTDDLPSQVRRFLSGGLVVEETQSWGPADGSGSRTGTARVVIKGTPAAMKGSLEMVADGDVTRLALDADLKAGVPLIGGQIERSAAPAIVAGIQVEAEEGRAYLAG
jgi:Protein of unknown function (DUF2505)